LAGFDLNRTDNFVPVSDIAYIDAALGPKRAGQIAVALMPKILASSAAVLLFHCAWSLLPGWRREILRSANHKLVIIAEAGIPNLTEVKKDVRTPISILTVSANKRVAGGIRVNFRHLKPRKAL
jgi:hypothetical protein